MTCVTSARYAVLLGNKILCGQNNHSRFLDPYKITGRDNIQLYESRAKAQSAISQSYYIKQAALHNKEGLAPRPVRIDISYYIGE